jgi:hypothetical protein
LTAAAVGTVPSSCWLGSEWPERQAVWNRWDVTHCRLR